LKSAGTFAASAVRGGLPWKAPACWTRVVRECPQLAGTTSSRSLPTAAARVAGAERLVLQALISPSRPFSRIQVAELDARKLALPVRAGQRDAAPPEAWAQGELGLMDGGAPGETDTTEGQHRTRLKSAMDGVNRRFARRLLALAGAVVGYRARSRAMWQERRTLR
jgi:hypothetical protein